jgi:hypothetical protein
MTLPKQLRRFRFGVRTLLLATLAVGLIFGWVHRGRDQREAVRQMFASNPGAALLYDYEVDGDGALEQLGEPPGPEWLRERLGIDHLSSVVGADLFYPTDVDLARLARFPNLRRLHLERSVDLTDAGMEHLAQLTTLRLLVLGEADQVTDAGLLKLASLSQLMTLRLDRGRHMTPSGIEQLQQRLPTCRIEVRDQAERDELAALE